MLSGLATTFSHGSNSEDRRSLLRREIQSVRRQSGHHRDASHMASIDFNLFTNDQLQSTLSNCLTPGGTVTDCPTHDACAKIMQDRLKRSASAPNIVGSRNRRRNPHDETGREEVRAVVGSTRYEAFIAKRTAASAAR